MRSGIPRFVRLQDEGLDETARRTQNSFGYEWTHFSDWEPSGESNFADYFSNFDLTSLKGLSVLDGGCGMGRHTRHVADHADLVVAVDFSRAIDAAQRNLRDKPNTQCVQADLTRLPFAPNTFDFVYSLGVLHHIDDTAAGLRSLLRVLKPGGRIRIYLYWKRTGLAGVILSMVTMIRGVTVHLPFSVLRVVCFCLSVLLTAVVIVPYRILAAVGVKVSSTWPLGVYAKYPFAVLYNDQFDRFSAPLEKRYSEKEVIALFESEGLKDIQVRPRYGWIADGVK